MEAGNNLAKAPIADPSPLTTDALKREVIALKELFTTRLDAMDKAMSLFQDNIARAPTEIDKQISHLKMLMEETFRTENQKFIRIDSQFAERDTRAEQIEKSSKIAIDAALSTQKEAAEATNRSNTTAINKSEAAFTKQIDGISDLIRATATSWDRQVSDIKERITRIESEYVGRAKEVVTQTSSNSNTISIISVIAGVVGLIVGVLITFLK